MVDSLVTDAQNLNKQLAPLDFMAQWNCDLLSYVVVSMLPMSYSREQALELDVGPWKK
jgi:hypothetical protein